jgi:carbohydrate-selective porin OprB
MVQKCGKNINSSKGNNQIQNKKQAGRRIADLNREQKFLDSFDNTVKNRMQDRMKFMSAKNAMRHNAELERIEKMHESVRNEISSLQCED